VKPEPTRETLPLDQERLMYNIDNQQFGNELLESMDLSVIEGNFTHGDTYYE